MIVPKICVIGSINMDVTITTDTVPKQGETVIGKDVATFPGGKGANQAVAAARLGANVSMIGSVGNDAFGDSLIGHLKRENIHIEGIVQTKQKATGVANIILSQHDNRIIVAPGANDFVTPEIVKQHQHLIKNSDVVLLQFEIPMETVLYTVKLAHQLGVKVIVNPAPFQEISKHMYEHVTYFTPNEIEERAMQQDDFFVTFQNKIIVTLGKEGVAYYNERGQKRMISAHQVNVVDTTGAGDTFNGALATEIARGRKMYDAITLANAAAALSITKNGAQTGMPAKEEVKQFLIERIS